MSTFLPLPTHTFNSSYQKLRSASSSHHYHHHHHYRISLATNKNMPYELYRLMWQDNKTLDRLPEKRNLKQNVIPWTLKCCPVALVSFWPREKHNSTLPWHYFHIAKLTCASMWSRIVTKRATVTNYIICSALVLLLLRGTLRFFWLGDSNFRGIFQFVISNELSSAVVRETHPSISTPLSLAAGAGNHIQGVLTLNP